MIWYRFYLCIHTKVFCLEQCFCFVLSYFASLICQQNEIDRLTKKVESEERLRRELEEERNSLADEKKRLLDQLKMSEDGAVEAQTIITRLKLINGIFPFNFSKTVSGSNDVSAYWC